MSLALYRVPDGQREKGQSVLPCPSVYSPVPALGSLSSVALSSVQAPLTLAQTRAASANYCPVLNKLSSGFLVEATNHDSSGFLREATGLFCNRRKCPKGDGLPDAYSAGQHQIYFVVLIFNANTSSSAQIAIRFGRLRQL